MHNLYLLVYAELGPLGFFLFLMCILSLWRVPRETFKNLESEFHVKHVYSSRLLSRSLVLYVLLLGVFDHYFWDVPQGIFLFWFVLGVAAASKSVLTNTDYST